jgi:hypothetical protein
MPSPAGTVQCAGILSQFNLRHDLFLQPPSFVPNAKNHMAPPRVGAQRDKVTEMARPAIFTVCIPVPETRI